MARLEELEGAKIALDSFSDQRYCFTPSQSGYRYLDACRYRRLNKARAMLHPQRGARSPHQNQQRLRGDRFFPLEI